ncbi:kinase-like domain-containing protein [Crassisporium funariophilum]|nr:kinase-like domain-containing protein [Crassisporium funariophilum]
MDSTEELQLLEITALQSIYAEDFVECPPQKAWKGAAKLHEFIIVLHHPDPAHASKISLQLHVKFPKTYPRLACATFALEKPIKGLNEAQISKLYHEITAEAQKLRGNEMVFSIVTLCQDWISNHVTPPVEVVGSLALQMNQRAMEEERARRLKEEEDAEREQELAQQAARELDEQIQADAMRQLLAKEQQYKARKRANSESTEVPPGGDGETPTENFGKEMEINGVRFNTVRLFHPRSACLGMVYMADPVVDDMSATKPLELYVVTFESHYYTTTQGRKKLKQVEQEIQKLTTLRHPKLLSVYAVKLSMPHSSGPPQLMVLTEQPPALSLHDVLEDCDALREDRVSDYLGQILTALNAIHISDLVHRGINARCIGLATRENSQPKVVKIGKAAYHTRLLDLHRSNSFGPHTPVMIDEPPIPEAWLSRDVQNESSLIYTRQRDLHAVGIVLLQMLMGLDVIERFPDAQTTIHSSSISPLLARQAMNMLQPPKKNHVTCLSLLAELTEGTLQSPYTSRTIPMSSSDPKTPMPMHFGSPDPDYFRMPARAKQASRWKEDWEELELLGKGAFGSVVKAKNKIDERIYAVKKVRLKTMQSDTKIFREVNALSRLSHRNIVRYYTTWVETNEPHSTAASDDSSAESSTDEDGMTSVPAETSERHLPINGGFSISIDDFDDLSSRSSFPSIHFERSGSPDDGFGSLFKTSGSSGGPPPLTPPPFRLTILQEFVERQTLKELVQEGISEDDAWRLFLQIVDALAHMSSHSILHRDIKLTNIFIGMVSFSVSQHNAKGDCKVGDFGLATSSLAAVDPSDVSPYVATLEADMTLEVGTRLYIAPEVQSRKRGPRNHSKADMYSLGIVFFEMNYSFTTGAERIAVLEDIRKPGIYFPSAWEPHRTRQKEIITLLLQHEPDKRPTAIELSQNANLPSRVEDEYFKGALRLMAKPDSPHHQTVLNSLFKQPPRPSRAFIYDLEADSPDYAPLNDTVQDRLVAIFHLHGAVDMEPPLLMPLLDQEEEKNHATFIDRHGDVVTLPNNILVPFARLAARTSIKRIKRFHIANVFRPSPVAGHPKVQKAAVFDIITPDLETGPIAAGAEIIAVVSDVLDSFPNLTQNYDIHISHSRIAEVALSRCPADSRSAVAEIVLQSKSTPAQRRALLLKKGLLKATVDELEILSEVEENIDDTFAKLEKGSPTLAILMHNAIKDIKNTIQFAQSAGVKRHIFFRPLMLGSHHAHFKDGVLVEVVRRNKHTDVLAAGGRYDSLIARFSPLKQKAEAPICALGVQIAVEKITAALASFQSASIKTLVKEERSFGFWSPRRCDVYVVSYLTGYLQDRLEVVAYLWQHGISADLMYESGLPEGDHENHLDICAREGILFTVYPRPRAARNLPAFKVKSILKGTEVDLSRQELVGWLQHEIADQKRIDATTSGAQNLLEAAPYLPVIKDPAVVPEVHLVLPDQNLKKQRKPVKQIFLDKAFEKAVAIKNSFQSGMPILAVDVSPAQFEAMARSSAWITEEEAWKTIAAMFSSSQPGYAHSVRESAIKRKAEGHTYILLFAVREDRAQLLAI